MFVGYTVSTVRSLGLQKLSLVITVYFEWAVRVEEADADHPQAIFQDSVKKEMKNNGVI